MGNPKFQRKTYSIPPHPWKIDRIQEETELQKKYGLKNKREIWKARFLLTNFRAQARSLQARLRYGDEYAQKQLEQLIGRLYRLGILPQDATLDNVLSLQVEDILDRRLQTVVNNRRLTKTISQARQFVVHGHIAVNGRNVTIPSYLVKRDEEDTIDFYEYSPLSDPEHPLRGSSGPPVENEESEKPPAQEQPQEENVNA